MNNLVDIQTIEEASERLNGVAKNTPLQFSKRLSNFYKANIYFKREDLQEVRSYKIRGAYNLIKSLSEQEKKKGVVCASAGNHAQGVAYSCNALKIHGTIFMPVVTPLQKINRVRHFGDGWVEIKVIGANFDESSKEAKEFAKKEQAIFVHPFDDERVIAGQGTIGKEIFETLGDQIDFLLCPIGGGGLISGVGSYLKQKCKKIKLIGVEAKGAPGMDSSIKAGKVITLEKIDPFVDGVAVKTVGTQTFQIASRIVDQIIVVDEGQVCSTMIELYQNEGIVAEPAGALSISALNDLAEKIKGRTVVCILSGGNNDILRYPEIMEKSLVYMGLKHYFLIEFAQKPGQLKNLVNNALGPIDDIVRFEYIKKNSKETGPALVGIELAKKEDLKPLLSKMNSLDIKYQIITSNDPLYSYLI
ncbi:threonine ammonia-lyase IlvA [Candidatus Daviesbacteria bacterium]|nr:threonine ammonia-lyase IlvA [Candidatus Daviesbacteria bacterium]